MVVVVITSNFTCPDWGIYLCPKVKPRVGAAICAPVGASVTFPLVFSDLRGAHLLALGSQICALVIMMMKEGHKYVPPGQVFVPWYDSQWIVIIIIIVVVDNV